MKNNGGSRWILCMHVRVRDRQRERKKSVRREEERSVDNDNIERETLTEANIE